MNDFKIYHESTKERRHETTLSSFVLSGFRVFVVGFFPLLGFPTLGTLASGL